MVIKCPNCSQYVSDTSSVCPKCGTHLGVSDTTMIINNVTGMSSNIEHIEDVASEVEVFPELAQYLRQHLILQKENPDISYRTVINVDDSIVNIYTKGNCYWEDEQPIRLGGYDNGFCLYLDFIIYADEDDEDNKEENKIENDRIQRLRNLAFFSQFIPHKTYDSDGDCHREYAIDLGDDIESASHIISEIVQIVYLVPLSDELDIATETIDDIVDDEGDAEEYVESSQTVIDTSKENKSQKWAGYAAGIGAAIVYLIIKSCS